MRQVTKTNWLFITLTASLLFFFSINLSEPTYANPDNKDTSLTDSTTLIVKYKDEIESKSLRTQALGDKGNIQEITVKNEDLEQTLHDLEQREDILHIEEDAPIVIHGEPNDYYYSTQWYLPRAGVSEAWKVADVSDQTITVAVIDTGIEASHEDLQGKVLAGYNFIHNNTNTTDDNGHGTAVSGMIAATYDNQIGISGVAGSADVDILPLKVATEKGEGKVSNMIRAIDYAVEQQVDMINISMGADQYSRILEESVEKARGEGILVISSAGNIGDDSYLYPAALDSVLSVGSVDQSNMLSSFSNYNDQVDFVAPGEAMMTTTPGNDYAYYDGTSFSSAMVSGMTAFMLAVNPALDVEQLVANLEESTTDLGTPGKDHQYGYGLVNLLEAVSTEGSDSVPEDEEPTAIPARFKELERLQVSGDDFYLQIKFNIGVDPASIHEETVYIVSENGEQMDVDYQFDDDYKIIYVLTPAENYTMEEAYYLFIDEGVQTTSGKMLAQPIAVQFMWHADDGMLTQQMMTE